jgi:hypothetical protein
MDSTTEWLRHPRPSHAIDWRRCPLRLTRGGHDKVGALEISKVTPREHQDMRYITGVAVLAVLALLIYIGVTGGQ